MHERIARRETEPEGREPGPGGAATRRRREQSNVRVVAVNDPAEREAGKGRRGVLWGAKSFVAGDIARSQKRLLGEMKAQKGGGAKKKKSVEQLAPDQTAAVKKLLKTQLRRRFDDLVERLGSNDDKVRVRAKKTVHVIAETNLAGFIARVNDRDFDELGNLHKLGRQGRSAAQQKRYGQLEGALLGIFQKQLSGVGG